MRLFKEYLDRISIADIVIFSVITIVIAVFSWNYSIKDKRYHGIPRFFAFESIVILIMLNIKYWFYDPFSFLKILSWIFLILSAVFGLAGWMLLKKHGKSKGAFEETTILVKKGLYKHIRHPLYSSLLLLGTGIMLKDSRIPQLILGIINLTSLYITARIEEKEMFLRFGDEYIKYKHKTKMFIPFLF